jgi:tetratricopeptide (TPR) repeat protein
MAQKLALLIGNNEYADQTLTRLAAPIADVEDLAQVLRDPNVGGFDHVAVVANETASVVQKKLARFLAQRNIDDLLMVYFSGHGILDDRGHLYLAAKDTERDLLSATAVSSTYLTNEMDRSYSRRQLLILDCCYSGAFARGSKAAVGSKAITESTFEGSGFGRMVLTASDSTQFAWDGDTTISDVRNSLFTHFLIQGLKTGNADRDGDGYIGLDELYDYVYEHLSQAARGQVPCKWAYKQQGSIVIARNQSPPPKVNLPPELQLAIESPLPSVRQAAVRELGHLLASRNRALVATAQELLDRIAHDDDSRSVSKLAADFLVAFAEGKLQPSQEQIVIDSLEEQNVSQQQAPAGDTVQQHLALDEAVSLYSRIIETDPQNVSAFLDRGDVYLSLERFGDALADYSSAQQLKPAYALVYIKLGTIKAQLGMREEAIVDLTTAIELEPSNANAYVQRANNYFALDRHSETLLDAEEALRHNSSLEVAHFLRAVSLQQLARYEEALAEYQETINLRAAMHSLALKFRADLLKGLQRYSDAITDYTQLIIADTTNGSAYFGRGQAHQSLQLFDEAVTDYGLAIENRGQLSQQELADTYLNRGVILEYQLKFEESISDYSATLTIAPDSESAGMKRGNLFQRLQQWSNALMDYTKVIQINERNASAHAGRGVALYNLQRYAEALVSYTWALLLEPNDYVTLMNRATLYSSQQSRHEEAMADYLKAAQINPHDPSLYFKMFATALLQGKKHEMGVYLRKAAELGEPTAQSILKENPEAWRE